MTKQIKFSEGAMSAVYKTDLTSDLAHAHLVPSPHCQLRPVAQVSAP